MAKANVNYFDVKAVVVRKANELGIKTSIETDIRGREFILFKHPDGGEGLYYIEAENFYTNSAGIDWGYKRQRIVTFPLTIKRREELRYA